jgi:hypothetical protein
LTTLHTFRVFSSAYSPWGPLLQIGDYLYGSTRVTGPGSVVYRIRIDGSGYEELKSFPAAWNGSGWEGADGLSPGALTPGPDGFLYAPAEFGGDAACYSGYGCGTAFRLRPDGSDFSVVRTFGPVAFPESFPQRRLIYSADGWMYGTTYRGVFRMRPDGTGFAMLYTLPGGAGSQIFSPPIEGADGRLYIAQYDGGVASPGGSIYSIDKAGGDLRVLHAFTFTAGGYGPFSVLYRDADGVLFGTTEYSAEAGSPGTVFAIGPGTFTRHFAEGVTGPFFDTTYSLMNPGTTATTATLTFRTSAGQSFTQVTPLPAGGRPVEVLVDSVPGMANEVFGTTIEAGAPLVVSRRVTWDASGYGSHASGGVPDAATEWLLPEGVTGPFDTYYLLHNPNTTNAVVDVTCYRPAPLVPVTIPGVVVPAGSRATLLANLIDPQAANTSLSARIRSTNGVPIVAERATYRSGTAFYEAGTAAEGVTAARDTWYFAEGATIGDFETFLLLMNPSASDAQVEVRYLRRSGLPPVIRTYTAPAASRTTIWVDAEPGLAAEEVGMVVRATNGVPVAAERAVWWGTSFLEGHSSPGAASTGLRWGVTDGYLGGPSNADTYLLVINPSATAGTARVTLYFDDGTVSASKDFPVPAEQRVNLPVSLGFPEANGRRFAAIVESVGASPAALVVERSFYESPGGVTWRSGANERAWILP